MKKNPLKIRRFIEDVLAIESEDAYSSGRLGFLARAMVMATLPHSKQEGHFFSRKNGFFTLTMIADPRVGLPYGALPRILLAWMTTEVVRNKSPILELGTTLSKFLKKLNLSRQGGARGDITRLREQMLRLFATHISCTYFDPKKGHASGDNFSIARSYKLWWKPLEAQAENHISNSYVTLAQDFFEELIDRPIPVDVGVLQILRRSPLQMDIYTWLTYRFSFLKENKTIPWLSLKNQFGADYANNVQGTRNFKVNFIKALKTVLMVYSTANVQVNDDGLRLIPSSPHIKKINKITKNH